MKSHFNAYIVNSVKRSMGAHFNNFIKARRQVNNTANEMFFMYAATKEMVTAQYEQEPIKTGLLETIQHRGEKIKKRGFTKTELAEIDLRLSEVPPYVHTPPSKGDVDVSAGWRTSKTKIDSSVGDKDATVPGREVQTGKPAPNNPPPLPIKKQK